MVEGAVVRPRRLAAGDRIAAVTLSWGGPATFPDRYAAGKRQLSEAFDVEIVEMPHTLADPEFIARHPEARADDLMQAFADSSIAGIVSTIGGDDSIRILPFIDLDTIGDNPKVFVGYSDTTVTHMACLRAGYADDRVVRVEIGVCRRGDRRERDPGRQARSRAVGGVVRGAGHGGGAVCPLLVGHGVIVTAGPEPVDVFGTTRPRERVVIRRASGEMLWPDGRAKGPSRAKRGASRSVQ